MTAGFGFLSFPHVPSSVGDFLYVCTYSTIIAMLFCKSTTVWYKYFVLALNTLCLCSVLCVLCSCMLAGTILREVGSIK